MHNIPWRKNVLTLVISGYLVVLVMFLLMVLKGDMNPTDAYDLLQGALMALIGGSLAISKDLIPLTDDESGVDNNQNGVNPKEIYEIHLKYYIRPNSRKYRKLINDEYHILRNQDCTDKNDLCNYSGPFLDTISE